MAIQANGGHYFTTKKGDGLHFTKFFDQWGQHIRNNDGREYVPVDNPTITCKIKAARATFLLLDLMILGKSYSLVQIPVRRLAEEMCCSKDTVQRARNDLIELGIIRVVSGSNRSANITNIYQIIEPIPPQPKQIKQRKVSSNSTSKSTKAKTHRVPMTRTRCTNDKDTRVPMIRTRCTNDKDTRHNKERAYRTDIDKIDILDAENTKFSSKGLGSADAKETPPLFVIHKAMVADGVSPGKIESLTMAMGKQSMTIVDWTNAKAQAVERVVSGKTKMGHEIDIRSRADHDKIIRYAIGVIETAIAEGRHSVKLGNRAKELLGMAISLN